MKLKDILNEGPKDWTVKDIIVLQKAHDRVAKATIALNKSVVALKKLTEKNASKPLGVMFMKNINDMIREFDKGISMKSKFWKTWEEYKKGAKAAFTNNWK